MFEPFFSLRMRLKKVRKKFWELVMKWMTLLSLMKPNLSILLLRETNPLHPLLPTLKHLTLILQVITSSRSMMTLFPSLNDSWSSTLGRYQVCCLEESLRISGRSMNRPLLTMQTSKRPLMTVKDDPTTNKKIEEASKTLVKISTQTTEILSSVRSFDFSTLLSTVKNIQDHAFKQEEASKDTSSIKSMMTEMYNAFRGQSSSAPSSSVTLTFAITNTPVNVKGKNATYTATEEPPSHTEEETDANIHENPKEPKQSTDVNIRFIGSSTHPPITKAQPITIIHPKPSIPQREGKGITTNDQEEDQEKYWDKEEKIKKAEEEARLNAISKTKVIKVVREEAKKIGIHLKETISSKAGELFKKA
nr:hypothetical protein [Tanacetum cinerariifolium]